MRIRDLVIDAITLLAMFAAFYGGSVILWAMS